MDPVRAMAMHLIPSMNRALAEKGTVAVQDSNSGLVLPETTKKSADQHGKHVGAGISLHAGGQSPVDLEASPACISSVACLVLHFKLLNNSYTAVFFCTDTDF